MPDGSSYTRTLIYPRDMLGRRVGLFDDRPSLNWYGFDEFWVYLAGEKLILGQGDTTLPHENAISSTMMVTNQEGTASGDIIFGPWGNTITGGGSYADIFADLGFQINYPLPPSATRDYNPTMGRWLVPDPGGRKVVDLANPQTWNMYTYVTDNPTSLNDPSGLYGESCGSQEAACDTYPMGYRIAPDSRVIFGYDIFDALMGSPGLYLMLTQSGALNFGFSVSKWFQDERAQEIAFENSPEYQQAIAAQYQTVSRDLKNAFPNARILSKIPKYVQGGHANFRIQCSGCAGRWANGLHIESKKLSNGKTIYWGHNDTTSPYIGAHFAWGTLNGWNLFVHGVVDVINGNLGNYMFPY